MNRIAFIFLILLVSLNFVPFTALAGPPFRTDDPEPVEYQHWEVYIATMYQREQGGTSATAPHLEINYGVVPNVQLHMIAPMEYAKATGEPAVYGFGDMELGVKWRFYNDEASKFMIGAFPLLEVPTGDDKKGLGNGDPQLFLPIWLQKAWGPWQTYGGGGYWFNPGDDHKDFYFLGWQLQREMSEHLILGGEFFYQSPSEVGGDHHFGFNGGGIINLNDKHHILATFGTDIDGPVSLYYYIGYQLTFGPEKEEKGPHEAKLNKFGFRM